MTDFISESDAISLPSEVWCMICSHLRTKDQKSLQSTSQLLYRSVRPILWMNASFWDMPVDMDDLKTFVDWKVPLKYLELEHVFRDVFWKEEQDYAIDIDYVTVKNPDTEMIKLFVEFILDKFPSLTLSLNQFFDSEYCLTAAQLEIMLRVPVKEIRTSIFCCKDEPGQRPVDFIHVLAQSKQRPAICVSDWHMLSNFVDLSTISDWEKTVQLNVVEIYPHFHYNEMGYPTNNIDIEKFDELVGSISPPPQFFLEDSDLNIRAEELSKFRKTKITRVDHSVLHDNHLDDNLQKMVDAFKINEQQPEFVMDSFPHHTQTKLYPNQLNIIFQLPEITKLSTCPFHLTSRNVYEFSLGGWKTHGETNKEF